MFTGIYQSMAILATVILFYATDVVFITRYDKDRQVKSGRSWDFTALVAVAALFLLAQPVFLPGLGLQIRSWWGMVIQAVGVLLVLGGLSLHAWSRAHLRQFYAERVEVQPEHYLIDTGPYAYVRHPMFGSYFLTVVGLLLINPALPTLLITIYTFWDFSGAARQEEKLLSERVPGYADYVARTSRFVPRLRTQGEE